MLKRNFEYEDQKLEHLLDIENKNKWERAMERENEIDEQSRYARW